MVATVLKLVVHVQCANHSQVHVNELCRKVEVALEIACVQNVEHHVGRLVDYLPSYVEFFRRVCRKGICSREVNNIEVVALESGVSLLCIDGHSRIVAYALVCPGGEIEQRGLSAIRIAHKSHVYGASFPYCDVVQLLVGHWFVVGIVISHDVAHFSRI